jgi:hypothetical protein
MMEAIVSVCLWHPGEQSAVTLDLTGKMITGEDRHSNPGGTPDPVILVYEGTINRSAD